MSMRRRVRIVGTTGLSAGIGLNLDVVLVAVFDQGALSDNRWANLKDDHVAATAMAANDLCPTFIPDKVNVTEEPVAQLEPAGGGT